MSDWLSYWWPALLIGGLVVFWIGVFWYACKKAIAGLIEAMGLAMVAVLEALW